MNRTKSAKIILAAVFGLTLRVAWQGAVVLAQTASSSKQQSQSQSAAYPGESQDQGVNESRLLLIMPFGPPPPAIIVEEAALQRSAPAALYAGDYKKAEADARRLIAIEHGGELGEEMLGQALMCEGKNAEALKTYSYLVNDMHLSYAEFLLPYSLLSLKAGNWPQAAKAFDSALDTLDSTMKARLEYYSNIPQPKQLASDIHVGLGLIYDAGFSVLYPQYSRALNEYKTAVEIAPDSRLARFYYAYGLKEYYTNATKDLPEHTAEVESAYATAATMAYAVGDTELESKAKQNSR